MALTKKIRFEVFKRDSFTCQYCGRKAPDVVLQCDHIEPKAKGGSDDILNLITSCFACNAGKSDRRLSDDSVVAKQREQLAQLQERKEQIEMMMEWQRSLAELDQHATEELAAFWTTLVPTFALLDSAKVELRKMVSRFGVEAVANAMRKAVQAYVIADGEGFLTMESVEKAFLKVGAICRISEAEKEKPYLKDLFYIRGILRNRFNYIVEWEAVQLLERAYLAGAAITQLKSIAFDNSGWRGWRSDMHDFIEYLESEGKAADGVQQD